MVRFVAIDFETASQRPDSACQIGIVVVDQGQIFREIVELIRPPSLYFSPRCIAVHGIHPDHVRHSPSWDEIWDKHQGVFEDTVVIAHNAGFDVNVLCASLSSYGIACPYMEYSCSRLIARRAWPGRSSYALKTTADHLGLTFQHHDALEDARVCAKIVLSAAEVAGAKSMDTLESNLGVQRGRIQFGVRLAPKSRSRRNGRQSQLALGTEGEAGAVAETPARAAEPSVVASGIARAIIERCGQIQPLDGKHVVLSGRLLGLDHESATAFLEQLGGCVQNKINLSTQYVIVGTAQDPAQLPTQDATSLSNEQIQEIEKRRREGQSIRVLSQRQLLALIPGGSMVARASIG